MQGCTLDVQICCSTGRLRLLPTTSFCPHSAPPSLPSPAQFEDPQGSLVFERSGSATGEFQFMSGSEGEYKLCFTAKGD